MPVATAAARMQHDSVRPSPAFGTLSPLAQGEGSSPFAKA